MGNGEKERARLLPKGFIPLRLVELIEDLAREIALQETAGYLGGVATRLHLGFETTLDVECEVVVEDSASPGAHVDPSRLVRPDIVSSLGRPLSMSAAGST